MSDAPTDLRRNLGRWSRMAQFAHDDLAALSRAKLTYGVHSVTIEGVPVDMMLVPRVGMPLIVSLGGNSPRSAQSIPPFFSGTGVTPQDMMVSFVSISDPVLAESDTLTLGWYGGSRQINLGTQLPALLEALMANLQPSHVLFFGGSGGGFAGLMAASRLPGSGALVWNPQTDIRDYEKGTVVNYARMAWDDEVGDIEAARQVLARNMVPALPASYAANGNRILYLQNAGDWHAKVHMQPFLQRNGYYSPEAPFTGRVGPGCYLHLASWGDGHAPPPKPALTALLRDLLHPDGAFWRDDDAALGQLVAQAFQPAPSASDPA